MKRKHKVYFKEITQIITNSLPNEKEMIIKTNENKIEGKEMHHTIYHYGTKIQIWSHIYAFFWF